MWSCWTITDCAKKLLPLVQYIGYRYKLHFVLHGDNSLPEAVIEKLFKKRIELDDDMHLLNF